MLPQSSFLSHKSSTFPEISQQNVAKFVYRLSEDPITAVILSCRHLNENLIWYRSNIYHNDAHACMMNRFMSGKLFFFHTAAVSQQLIIFSYLVLTLLVCRLTRCRKLHAWSRFSLVFRRVAVLLKVLLFRHTEKILVEARCVSGKVIKQDIDGEELSIKLKLHPMRINWVREGVSSCLNGDLSEVVGIVKGLCRANRQLHHVWKYFQRFIIVQHQLCKQASRNPRIIHRRFDFEVYGC